MIDSSRPQGAPLPLLLCTGVILASTILMMAGTLAMFAATGDPCSLMGILMLLPLIFYLALLQYRAVFRAEYSAASHAANFLLIIAPFLIFGFIRTLYEMVLARVAWDLSLLLTMFSIALFTTLTGYLDLNWSRKLKPQETSQASHTSPRTFTRRDKLAAGIATFAVIVLTAYFIISTPPQFAENVTPDKSPIRLPATATHVSFCQGERGTIACEFTIDEPTFVTWVNSGIGSLESKAAHIPLKPITTPIMIDRYPSLSPSLQGDQSIMIQEGLEYLWSKEDRRVHALFDRPSNRAFYFAQYH